MSSGWLLDALSFFPCTNRTISHALFHLLLTGHTGKSLRTKDVRGKHAKKKEARSWEQSITKASECFYVLLSHFVWIDFSFFTKNMTLKISVTNFKETIWCDNNWAGGNVLIQVLVSCYHHGSFMVMNKERGVPFAGIGASLKLRVAIFGNHSIYF